MIGFTDIHQHLLYGVDDGARTLQMMEEMLLASSRDGVTCLVATPHVTPGIKDPGYASLSQRFEEASAIIQQMHLPLELLPGAENLFTPMIVNAAMNHTLITIGSTNKVLLEFNIDVSFAQVEHAADLLTDCGYQPIFAHVERYDCLRRNLTKAARLKKQYKLLYQMNGNTVISRSEGLGGIKIRQMLKNGLIDMIATDAHNTIQRATCMTKAYTRLCEIVSKEEAKEMCCFGIGSSS